MYNTTKKYIYLSNVFVDGTIFQTQVLDWLHLFFKNGIEFELIQIFTVRELLKPKEVNKQINYLKKHTKLSAKYMFFFPSRNLFYVLNTFIIISKIVMLLFKYDKVLIFSRALIGKEILLLRRIMPHKIVFYYDARGAGGEENKYDAIKSNDYSLRKFKIVSAAYYLEFITLVSADKVFVVTRVLENYFKVNYNLREKRYILYPCLSDSRKFYYSIDARKEVRNRLGISDTTRVYIYSGGVGPWHLSEKILALFSRILQFEKNSLLLYLAKDSSNINNIIFKFPQIEQKCLTFSVPNSEVYNYLNAADYGLLLRENTMLNNVASPTKFAEYISLWFTSNYFTSHWRLF